MAARVSRLARSVSSRGASHLQRPDRERRCAGSDRSDSSEHRPRCQCVQHRRAFRRQDRDDRAASRSRAASKPMTTMTRVLTASAVLGLLVLTIAPRDPARASQNPQTAQAPVFSYQVVNRFPHDPNAFTQGLIYRDGHLFESTGLKGQSSLRKVKLETGAAVELRAIDKRYFAEGLTDWGNRLLTAP